MHQSPSIPRNLSFLRSFETAGIFYGSSNGGGVTGYRNFKMSEYKKTILSTNYTSHRNASSSDPPDPATTYDRRENSLNYIPPGNIKQASSRIITTESHEGLQGDSRYSVSQRRIVSNEAQSNVRTSIDWEGDKRVVLSGDTDFTTLKHTKDLLLNLLGEFSGKSKVVFEGEYKEDFSQRLLLLEHELEGTMRRVLNVSQADPSGSKRSLDYVKLIGEKENALIDKQRKIANFQERLRLAEEKVVTLEIEIQGLTGVINQRNSQIQELRRQLEIKGNAIDKIRGQPSFANSQELREILRLVRLEEEGNAQNAAIRTHISQLERELNKLKSKESSLLDLDIGIESWIMGLPGQSTLKGKVSLGETRLKEDERYRALQDKFSVAAQLYRQQVERLQRDNPNIRISADTQILESLRASNTRVTVSGGVVQIEKEVKVTKEIPVQDSRTKYLISALAAHVRKINEKYPKLKGELDIKLQELMGGEMADIIEGDSLDRIVDIVRYVPQMVKVENVYTYSSERNRKVEFHLRVLIKALLEEMEKAKSEKGMVFEIDEGVIGMIRAEIMDIVDVDDILKVYRAVPKIVEVPKIIEKVVDNIVRVPEKYTLNQLQSQAVPLQKPQIAVDQKALIIQHSQPVPLFRDKAVELMSHTEKVVSHPEVNERVVIQVREKTKAQPEEVHVDRIVEVQKPVIVEVEKIIIQEKITPVEIIKEVVRYMETEKEVPKPIEVIVEKIVEKVIEREKIVIVPQIVEKIVEVIRYEKVPEIMPHVETRIEIVKEIVEKIVPVIHVEQVIVTVPQIVEKLVTTERVVELPPREIEVIREVLRIVKEYEIIEIEVPRIIYETRVEIRQVEKYVEVPIIVPQIKVETEIHQVPFVETVHIEKHIPVEVIKHVILTEEKPVEVIKNVPFIMREEVPVLVREEKIIPQEIYMERIKEVPTTKEKIIEKIVEVPRCVQIEKIVERIVIVPRIIEKIVLVPQIIEKIVEKIVQVPIEMPPVQHYIPQNIYIDRPVQVDRERIVYLNVDRAVEVPGDQILVKDLQTRTNIQVEKVIEQRVVINREEVPVTIHVDKIVTVPVEKKEIEFVDRVIFKPIEVPVPVNIQRTVPVYINTETVKVEPVTQIVEKIVEKVILQREPQIIPQIQEKVYVEQKYEFKEIPKPYIEERIKEVERFEEKIIAITTTIDQIKEIPYYIEKLVPIIQEIPKIYEYEKEPKVVFTPPSIEIVDRIVPKIINVNKYIERIVERLVEVPHLMREIELVKQIHEKNIPGPMKTNTTLKTVNLEVEKEMIREREKIVETRVNFIEETLRTVTEIMERERDPVIITQDRIIQIPHVIQKIVEKVVMMPQIVEVLKYVHELVDNDELSLGLSVDVSVEAQEYKKLGEDLERGFADFLAELNKVKSLQPSAAQRIAMIEQYLAKFRRFIKYPKIHEIIREKVVEKEKEKVVRVPMQKGPAEVREELAKVLLIEKLVAEISRIKRTHPEISLQLQEDINFIFRLNFQGKVRDVNSKLNAQLKDFQSSLDKKFSKMGGWSKDHQVMLKSFLEERFVLANIVKNANDEIKVSRKQNEELATENSRANAMLEMVFKALLENKEMMPGVLNVLGKERGDPSLAMAYSLLLKRFDEVIDKYNSYQREDFEPTRYLGRKLIEEMIGSSLREKEKEIELLKERLRGSRVREGDHAQCNIIIQSLQSDINRINQQLTDSSLQGKNTRSLQMQIDRLNKLVKESSSSSINKSNDVRSLQNEISRLKLTIQQGADHTNCNNVKRGLESQNRRLKEEIDALLAKYRGLEKEMVLLRSESPKKTVITSIGGREREEGKRSIVISHVDRESEGDGQDYGQNYQEYMNGDPNMGGTVEHQGYHSGIMEPRDLANSAATYRSGQVITSSQFVRPPTTTNIESARYLGDREGTQYSTSTAGASGVKKYNYYQKRYEGNP